MAATGIGTKYHVGLNGQGYLVRGRGFNKKNAPVFAPRFNTGEQGAGDLDLYKTYQRRSFAGGMFQAIDDPKVLDRVNRIQNMMWQRETQVLTGAPVPTATTGFPGASTPSCFQEFRGNLYAGVGTALYKMDFTGAWTSVKTGYAQPIQDLCVMNNKLFIAYGAAGAAQGFESWDGTTFTANSTPFNVRMCVPFRDAIYTAGANTSATGGDQGHMQKHAGTVPNGNVVDIGAVGDENKPINNMVVWNQRLMVGKQDGLFAFDGVIKTNVLDTSSSPGVFNFYGMEVFNGALYFNIDRILYRLAGSTVEIVQRFPSTIQQLKAAFGVLFISVSDLGNTGPNPAEMATYSYDGTALTIIDTNPGYFQKIGVMLGFGADTSVTYVVFSSYNGSSVPQIVTGRSYSGSGTGGGSSGGYVELSEFDANYPHIDKFLASISMDVYGLGSTSSILVEARSYDGKTWSAYSTVGTISTALGNKVFARDTSTWRTNSWKRLQVRCTVTQGNGAIAIKGINLNYFLAPDYKRQWTLILRTQGQSDDQLLLADNQTYETQTAKQLRDTIYALRDQKYPFGYEDIDYTALNLGSQTSAVTTILTVGSTAAFPAAGFVKIDDEIIQYTGKTATTFTGCTRGVLGTTAATHNDPATVSTYYRVVMTDINNESVISVTQDVYGSPSEMIAVLQEA